MGGLLVKYSSLVGNCKNGGEDRIKVCFTLMGSWIPENANLQCFGLSIDTSHTLC